MCSGPQRIDHVWCSCVYVLCVYLCVSVSVCVCVCVCMCVWVCVFPGKFLNDAIMADVIDYDEFLTGGRNEATYTMFKGHLSLSLSRCVHVKQMQICASCICLHLHVYVCVFLSMHARISS